jgi:hypothetical protein
MWVSPDQGGTWTKVKQLTHNSALNHNYARRPFNANPEFYALWADGNPLEPSESHVYFTNKRADHVWRLPAKMDSDFAKPEIAW